jgi:hypothetical protein
MFSAHLHIEMALHPLVIHESHAWVRKSQRKQKINDEQAQDYADVEMNLKEDELQHHDFHDECHDKSTEKHSH